MHSNFFSRVQPIQPGIGLAGVFLSTKSIFQPTFFIGLHFSLWVTTSKTRQACSKAMSRAILLIPMQVCSYQVTHCPEGRLQLHWERATKAVHQIPRSKTPDSVTLDR